MARPDRKKRVWFVTLTVTVVTVVGLALLAGVSPAPEEMAGR